MNINILGKALYSILLVLFLTITPAAMASSVSLVWDPVSDPQLSGYKVLYGFSSRNYQHEVDVGDSTSLVVSALKPGTTYYFTAVAYSADGRQSDYSDEIIYTTATAPIGRQSDNSDEVIKTPATDRTAACTYMIWPAGLSVNASGGTVTVFVSAPAGCRWTASSSTSWIHLAARNSGMGPGIVRYTVKPAMAGVSRAATITVAGKSFVVNQVFRYRIHNRNPNNDLSAGKFVVPDQLPVESMPGFRKGFFHSLPTRRPQ